MIQRVSELVLRLIGDAANATSLAAFLQSNPVGWVPFGFILGSIGLQRLVQATSARSTKGELDELLRILLETEHELDPQLSQIQLNENGELRVEGTPRTTKAAFAALMTRRAVDQHEAQQAVLAALDGNAKLLSQIVVYLNRQHALIQRVPELQHELALIRELGQELGARIDATVDSLLPKPPLSTPLTPITSPLSRLDYRTQAIPLFGRESEMDVLNGFLSSQPPFAWWLMYGGGGVGKSRLALELILHAQYQGWSAGFLSEHRSFEEWDRWAPCSPTLLVVDYVGRRQATRVSQAMAALAERSCILEHNVRVLLIDRAGGSSSSLYRDLLSSARTALTSLEFAEPLYLSPLDPVAALDAILFVLRDKGESDKATSLEENRAGFLQLLQAEEDYRKPLALQLMVEGMVRYGEAPPRPIIEHVRAVLERELDKWYSLDATNRYLNILLLATLAGDLTFDALIKLAHYATHLFPNVNELDQELLESLTGHEIRRGSDGLRGVTPSILGDSLILERLDGQLFRHQNCTIVRAEMTEILQLATSHAGIQVAEFAQRCAVDFATHPRLEQVLVAGGKASPEPNKFFSSLIATAHPESLAIVRRLADEYSGTQDTNTQCEIELARGNRHFRDKELEAAVDRYSWVIDQPQSDHTVAALLQRSHTYSNLRQTDLARADCETVLANGGAEAPDQASAIALRAVSHLVDHDWEACRTDCETALKLEALANETRAYVRMNLARAYAALGMRTEARGQLEALADAPRLPQLREQQLEVSMKIHEDEEDWRAASEDARALLEITDGTGVFHGEAQLTLAKAASASRDHLEVIRLCSLALDLLGDEGDLVAECLLGRADAQSELGHQQDAIQDLKEALKHITSARKPDVEYRLGVVYLRDGDHLLAQETLTAVIASKDCSAMCRAGALISRAAVRRELGDEEGSLEDLSDAIEGPDTPHSEVGRALLIRAGHHHVANPSLAESDYVRACSMLDQNSDMCQNARLGCGRLIANRGDHKAAMAIFTEVVETADPLSEWALQGLLGRGNSKGAIGEYAGAVDDFSSVIGTADAPAELQFQARLRRGMALGAQGMTDEAELDWAAIIDGCRNDSLVRRALWERAEVREQAGDLVAALGDLDRAMAFDAEPSSLAQARERRGILLGRLGKHQDAIDEFTVLAENAVTPTTLIQALYNRGFARQSAGDYEGALQDYDAAIGCEGPSECKLWAHLNRGDLIGRLGRYSDALRDFDAVTDHASADPDQKARALLARAQALGMLGRKAEAIRCAEQVRKVGIPPEFEQQYIAIWYALTGDAP